MRVAFTNNNSLCAKKMKVAYVIISVLNIVIAQEEFSDRAFVDVFRKKFDLLINSNLREKLKERNNMPFVFCGSIFPLLKYKFCDGKRDCADGSDESVNICKYKKCSESEFRCAYGACISKNNICDGIFHCADGSDEDRTTCANSNCIVPLPTEGTAYYVIGCSSCLEGTEVKEGTMLKFQCLNQSTPFMPKSIRITCESSKWIPFIPTCEGNDTQIQQDYLLGNRKPPFFLDSKDKNDLSYTAESQQISKNPSTTAVTGLNLKEIFPTSFSPATYTLASFVIENTTT